MDQYYSLYPDKAYFQELIRPWKIMSFCCAMILLLYGALTYDIVDWDVGVTLVMGSLTYIMAPWCVYIILSAIRYRRKFWFFHIWVALLIGLFVVDWAYMIYHTLTENQTLRTANLYASTPLFYLAGAVWLYRGSLKDFMANIRKLQ
jgi:hypothetical protein